MRILIHDGQTVCIQRYCRENRKKSSRHYDEIAYPAGKMKHFCYNFQSNFLANFLNLATAKLTSKGFVKNHREFNNFIDVFNKLLV